MARTEPKTLTLGLGEENLVQLLAVHTANFLAQQLGGGCLQGRYAVSMQLTMSSGKAV